MKEFLRKHEDRIHSVLSCFDRMLFRGYLPIMSGWAMAQFLNILELNGSQALPVEKLRAGQGPRRRHGQEIQPAF
jgi:hypothetical protein